MNNYYNSYYDYDNLYGGAMDSKQMMMWGIGAIVVIVIVVLIIFFMKKAKFTAEQQADFDKKVRSWQRNYDYPQGFSISPSSTLPADVRMGPNTQMPSLSGVDQSGSVYADQSAAAVVGGFGGLGNIL